MQELLLFEGAEVLLEVEPEVFFGLFGFIKKISRTVKKIGGAALGFVPGGGLIRTGLGVATQGLGAIIKGIKGGGGAPTRGGAGGTPIFTQPQTFTQPTTGSAAFNFPGSGKILGFEKTTALAIGGVILVAVIFFMQRR